MKAAKYAIIVACVLGTFLVPANGNAATLSMSPSSATIRVGKTVTVSVRVGSADQAMNSAEAAVTFPSDLLQLQSISKTSSIFQFWTTEPAGSNASGRIVFSGGLPSPGFSGGGGNIIRITFLAKAKGTATLGITGAKVLANDGLGTDILTSSGGVTYTIQAAEAEPTPVSAPAPQIPDRPTPILISSTHPDQDRWYTTLSALVQWSNTAGQRGVSFSVSQNADDEPDGLDEAAAGSAEVALPGDGVWYFHLKARYDSGWSSTFHYALRRDATPPESFTVEVKQNRGAFDPTPVLAFAPRDATSGIDRTALIMDGGAEQIVTSPLTLHDLAPGKHHAVITAYDKAGNTASASADFTTEGYPAPTITSLRSPIILLQPIEVFGTSTLGDLVIVYLNGEELGRTVLGHADSDVVWETPPRIPWSVKSDRLFRPGTYHVTAKAISPTGQGSVLTDPLALRITGSFVMLGGRPLATIAFAPAAILLFGLGAVLALFVLADLLALLMRLRNREGRAKLTLRRLRQRARQEHVSTQELDATLLRIEESLGREAKRRLRRRA